MFYVPEVPQGTWMRARVLCLSQLQTWILSEAALCLHGYLSAWCLEGSPPSPGGLLDLFGIDPSIHVHTHQGWGLPKVTQHRNTWGLWSDGSCCVENLWGPHLPSLGPHLPHQVYLQQLLTDVGELGAHLLIPDSASGQRQLCNGPRSSN